MTKKEQKQSQSKSLPVLNEKQELEINLIDVQMSDLQQARDFYASRPQSEVTRDKILDLDLLLASLKHDRDSIENADI